MENSPLNELALKIYNNHKQLLDFIFEVKPDDIRLFDEMLKNFIESKGYILGSQNKGYVRFLPKSISNIIPKWDGRGGWPQKESFLFEIVNWSEKKVSLKAVVAPGDTNVRNILMSVLQSLPGAQKPSGSLWMTYFQLGFNINYKMLSEKTKDEILRELEQQWPKAEEMILKVTKAILTQEDALQQIISKQASINKTENL